MIEDAKYWIKEKSFLARLLIVGVLIYVGFYFPFLYFWTQANAEATVVKAVYERNRIGFITAFTGRLTNGNTVAFDKVLHKVEVGEIVCLKKGRNIFGLAKYKFSHVGNCT